VTQEIEQIEQVGGGELLDLTKAELYEKAKALDIDGRSKMNKEELATAVRRA
jgi:hypothetical protein